MRARHLVAVACCAALVLPAHAAAETSHDVRAQIDEQTRRLNVLNDQISVLSSESEASRKSLSEVSEQTDKARRDVEDAKRTLSASIRDDYKASQGSGPIDFILGSKSIDELISRARYARSAQEHYRDSVSDLKRSEDVLTARQMALDEMNKEYNSAAIVLDRKRQEAEGASERLRERLREVQDRERRSAEAAIAAQQRQESLMRSCAARTFPTEQESGWVTCVASAYSIADNSPAGSRSTASGIPLDESSPTVAMPMSSSPAEHYGHHIEISYGGMSVIATVTDCGGMGGGSRGLDLTPAVFRAFGATSCDSWGLRTVRYRFVD